MSYPVYTVPAGDVLPIFFSTYAGSTGASVTLTGLAVTDIEIYKDGSTTQRSSDAGYTLLDTDGIDFDSLTGIHGFSIDTGDNTDSGFYTVGAWFHVVVSAVTVDSQTVSFIAAAFRLMPAETVAGKPKVDTDTFGGTAGTFASGRPEVRLADGVAHGGSTASLRLGSSTSTPALLVENSGGDAARLTSSGGNGNGLQANGHGTGAGLRGKGGATGDGIEGEGGATSGNGYHGHGPTSGSGMYLLGTGDGDGLTAVGAASAGMGAHFIAGTGSDLHGIGLTGDGAGDGLRANGGATGNGIQAGGVAGIVAQGGSAAAIGAYSTSSHGIEASGGTSGDGITAYSSGTNRAGMKLQGLGTGTEGLRVYADDGDAIQAEVGGSGKALSAAEIDAIRDRLSTLVTKTGAVVDDVSNSATTFETNLTESADDHYKDCLIKFTSGSLAEQVKKITAYNGTTKFVTVDGGFTAEPTAADTFEIVNE